MKCLIIAAGKGSRLKQRGDSKPLIPILGIPMIERVIRTALEAGVDEFYVVIGYQGEQVRLFLERLAERLAIRITPLVNEDWEKDNGLSVLKARDVLHEPFLLLMADHLFDVHALRDVLRDHLGAPRLGAHAVDANVGRQLDRHRTGEVHDAALRRAVHGALVVAFEPRYRGDVHDRPSTRAECCERRPRSKERPLQVYVHGLVPGGFVGWCVALGPIAVGEIWRNMIRAAAELQNIPLCNPKMLQ